MSNRLKELFESLLFGKHSETPTGESLKTQVDSNGIIFYTTPQEMNNLKAGRGSPFPLLQSVVLQMLFEQGAAEDLPNGYRIDSEVVAALDEEQAELLCLPSSYPYGFTTQVQGHTRKSSFKVTLFGLLDGQEYPIQRKGPYLSLGGNQIYRLNPYELIALKAVEKHELLVKQGVSESDNLQLMASLQLAKRSGMNIDLGSFNNLDVVVPEGVGVVATKLPDGSLELCPSLGDGSSIDQLDKRWSQLDVNKQNGVLRIENRLVLLDQEKMAAVKEVLGAKRIPRDKVEDFLRTPSAFLDASIVNLDLGFSLRVLGVGKLVHMDFGPLDNKKNDWFSSNESPNPPEKLLKDIKCLEELDSFKEKVNAARQQGATSVEFQNEQYDISDTDRTEKVLQAIEKALNNKSSDKQVISEESPATERVTVLLEDAEQKNQQLISKAQEASPDYDVKYSQFVRTPFPHQIEGINWMLGLLMKALSDDHEDLYRIQGGLLADDMGLGKTFMTLVVLGEYLSIEKTRGKTQKPVLVVAPLSLLENWEQEIKNTFQDNPFRDIKVLQSDRDLKDFRIKGADRESVQFAAALDENDTMSESDIRYALRFGSSAGTNRLDMDRRLVLTTYQTLRDYQFSLCMIDWGVVVFDEAQNIKNPNALQTRAAKGLKADFKLLATGTPVENSLGDFWCLMDTAQPGLLGDWIYFRDHWVAPIVKATEEERDTVRIAVGASLRKSVGPFMLRRIKEDQLSGLPKKYIRTGLIQKNSLMLQSAPELAEMMSEYQLKAYNTVIEDYRQQKATEDMRGRALSALQQLRTISLHPRLHETSILTVNTASEARRVMCESAKLKVLLKQLDQIKQLDEKIILFMVNKQLQRALKLWLGQIYGTNFHIVNGDTAAVQKKKDVLTRKRMIDDFESVHGFNIIIMSPVAAGVGLTVVGANHVMHLERHWNPAKEAQATDRVYRIGQQKDVFIHLPAALHPEYDSFDVNLDRLLNGKLMIKDAVVTPEPVQESDLISSMGL